MNYICSKCSHDCKTKQSLQRHLAKKIPCDNKIKCERCHAIFSSNQALKYHMNKKNKCIIINLESKNIELELKITNLQLQNELLQLKQTINSNNTININNNITNNITLNNFGNESGRFFTKKNIIELISTELDNYKIMWNDPILKNQKYLLKDNKNEYKYSLTTIPDLNIALFFISNLYNNPNYPEDLTIKYNIIDDNFEIYKDNSWVIISDLDVINISFDTIRNIIKREKVLDKQFFKQTTKNGLKLDHDNIRIYVGEFDKKSEQYITPFNELKIININERYCLKLIISLLKNTLLNQKIDHSNNILES